MKMFKRTVVLLAVMSLMISYSAKSSAAGTGIVDLDKIRDNYTVAQELTADLKVKESDLQKFIMDAQKQIQEAKTPVEKKNLEDKLGEQFNVKRNAYAKDQTAKWSKIEDTVISTIKAVSASKKFDMVLNKQVVIDGGYDITDEVIAKLNTQAKK
jgi:Skp family chaperone for outer membrane proteins